MAEPLTIALTLRVDEDMVRRIESVAPGVRVVMMPELSNRTPPDDETRARLVEAMHDVDILVAWSGLDARYLEAATRLRWWQVTNAGVDRLAADGLLGRGFQVTNVSGMSSGSIAEWVMGAVIMFEKGFHQSVRDQLEHRWNFRWVGEVRGKTMGIVGMGAIGRDTARRARAFGMRVVGSRRTVTGALEDPDCDLMLPYSELGRLLEESDYLVLAVPLTPETDRLIGEAELRRMKPAARLVNIARGPVVDTAALVEALRAGTIAGAALDVTDPEPLPAGHPLWDMPNVILTPHISGALDSYYERAAAIFIQNLERFVAARPLANLVRPDLGY